jgi:type II secretory pathway component PulL
MQLDNLNQLPKEKRPPEWMIWDSPPEEIEKWLDRVYDKKKENTTEVFITESEIE